MSWADARTLRQFLAFTGVGAVGTAGHYLTLILFVEGFNTDPVIATSLGFVVGALINYILNYKYTFASDSPHGRTLVRFFIVALVGALVNSGIMYLGATLLDFNYLLIQLLATAIVLLQNFVLNRLWTFAQSGEAS